MSDESKGGANYKPKEQNSSKHSREDIVIAIKTSQEFEDLKNILTSGNLGSFHKNIVGKKTHRQIYAEQLLEKLENLDPKAIAEFLFFKDPAFEGTSAWNLYMGEYTPERQEVIDALTKFNNIRENILLEKLGSPAAVNRHKEILYKNYLIGSAISQTSYIPLVENALKSNDFIKKFNEKLGTELDAFSKKLTFFLQEKNSALDPFQVGSINKLIDSIAQRRTDTLTNITKTTYNTEMPLHFLQARHIFNNMSLDTSLADSYGKLKEKAIGLFAECAGNKNDKEQTEKGITQALEYKSIGLDQKLIQEINDELRDYYPAQPQNISSASNSSKKESFSFRAAAKGLVGTVFKGKEEEVLDKEPTIKEVREYMKGTIFSEKLAPIFTENNKNFSLLRQAFLGWKTKNLKEYTSANTSINNSLKKGDFYALFKEIFNPGSVLHENLLTSENICKSKWKEDAEVFRTIKKLLEILKNQIKKIIADRFNLIISHPLIDQAIQTVIPGYVPTDTSTAEAEKRYTSPGPSNGNSSSGD